MTSYVDRLEGNLKRKADVLEEIYVSDTRFLDRFDVNSSDLDQYDDYLVEQNSYLDMLDELDTEYDEIFAYLSEHPTEVNSSSIVKKNSVNTLAKNIEGKIQAVNSIEARIKAVADDFFAKRKTETNGYRRAARVIQNHYRPNPGVFSEENTMFDVSN